MSAFRSPLVSRISQRFGGSPTSTPRSSTLSARGRTSPSANTVRLSITPSLVRVFEHDDAADRLGSARTREVAHVAGHLDDPQAAVGIPVDRDGVLNQRFAGHELERGSRAACRRSSARRPPRAPAPVCNFLDGGRPGLSRPWRLRPVPGGHRRQHCQRDDGEFDHVHGSITRELFAVTTIGASLTLDERDGAASGAPRGSTT